MFLTPQKPSVAALDASDYKGDKKYRLSPDNYKNMFEIHIEQGPILEDAGKDVV